MDLTERFQLAEGFLPQALLGAAANDGDWVSLKNHKLLHVIFYAGPGLAAEPATITLEQASDVAGTGAKAVTFTTYYKKQAATNLQAVGTFTKVTQAAAATAILGVGADGDKAALVVITINASDLDVNNGFDCVRGRVADLGTSVGSAPGGMLYLLEGPRYAPPLSVLAN